MDVDQERLLLAYRLASDSLAGSVGADWVWLAQTFDASILSNEASLPGNAKFTGAFVGMTCQDMSGMALHADFDFFEYVERPYCIDPASRPARKLLLFK